MGFFSKKSILTSLSLLLSTCTVNGRRLAARAESEAFLRRYEIGLGLRPLRGRNPVRNDAICGVQAAWRRAWSARTDSLRTRFEELKHLYRPPRKSTVEAALKSSAANSQSIAAKIGEIKKELNVNLIRPFGQCSAKVEKEKAQKHLVHPEHLIAKEDYRYYETQLKDLITEYKNLKSKAQERYDESLSKATDAVAKIMEKLKLPMPNDDHFKCPISMEFMSDPVVVSDGHTYERSEITKILKQPDTIFGTSRVSPLTREKLDPKILLTNYKLKDAIDAHAKWLHTVILNDATGKLSNTGTSVPRVSTKAVKEPKSDEELAGSEDSGAASKTEKSKAEHKKDGDEEGHTKKVETDMLDDIAESVGGAMKRLGSFFS